MFRYTEKVDLYSLGIIFFEMCYRPMTKTAMERADILHNLRTVSFDGLLILNWVPIISTILSIFFLTQKEIVFPKDFDRNRLDKQTQIIRWLLCHNPDERPTSLELLKNKHIQPMIKDNELKELLNHTLANTNSARYRTLISCVMNQQTTQNPDHMSQSYFVYESCRQLVHNKLVEKLPQYGFQPVSIPQLVPKDKVNEKTSQVVMDHSGAISSLPNDLRMPFARQLAMVNVESLKRFDISRVYKQRPKLGKPLQEHHQCVIDIVTSSPHNFVPDAEILWTVAKIIEDFPCLVSTGCYIGVNHADLPKSILAFTGVAEEKIPEIIALLQERGSENDSEQQVKELLENVGLCESTVSNICRWFYAPVNQLLSCQPAEKAVKQLLKICHQATELGMKDVNPNRVVRLRRYLSPSPFRYCFLLHSTGKLSPS